MSALFAHDHRFPVVAGVVHHTGRFGDFRQYTDVAGSLRVVARGTPLPTAPTGALPVSNPEVSFELLSNLGQVFSRGTRAATRRRVAESEVVIARLPSVIGSAVGFEALRQDKPLVVELVGCAWDAYRLHGRAGRAAAPAMWAATRLLVRRADHVLYVTDEFLQRRYPTRGRSNAVSDVELAWSLGPDDVARRRQHRLPGPWRLGTAAVVDVAYKGQDRVVGALPGLLDAGWDVEYHLAGGGDQARLREAAARAGVGERVHFSGAVAKSDMPAWLDGLDVYVQPSLTEGLPRALIEAMSRGLPAVASAVGGIPELLAPDRLFDPDDADQVTRVLTAALSGDHQAAGEDNLLRTKRFDFAGLDKDRRAFYAQSLPGSGRHPGPQPGPARVLHVLGQMYRGGAESRTMDLYRSIDRSQLQFDFLVMKEGQHHYAEEIGELGGELYFVRPPLEGGFVAFVTRIVRILRTRGPFRAVHVHTDLNAGLVVLAARLARVPVRVVHSRTAPPLALGPQRRAYGVVMRALILGNATRLVTCGTEAGYHLFGRRAMRSGQVEFLPNAIDLDAFEVEPVRVAETRRELGLHREGPVVGHVGNLRAVKNHPFLLEVFARLLTSRPDATLLLIGEGPDEPELRRLAAMLGIADRVEFLGARSDVPVLLHLVDLVIMPSLWEGVPGAVVETQACAVPCLLSDTISRDVDAKAGLLTFLSLSEGADAWAAAADRLLDVERVPADTARAALQAAGFDAEVSARRLPELYGLAGTP